MPSLGIFDQKCVIWVFLDNNSTLTFVKSEWLFHAVNFGIGSAFSEGPESGFSEGPGPGLGLVPLYKVCRLHAHK